jgi:predicted dehydrogenase
MNKDLIPTTTRRVFLKQSAAALTVPFAAPLILAKPVTGANTKLNLAWVGFGNQGGRDLMACAKDNNVVALCDCDPNCWPRMQQKFPQAKFYKDFRIMLAEMGDKIDAVGVGTPDHTHFAVAYMAMKMGKHVFVEKPLTHSVWEARTLQQLAAE